MKEIKFLKDLQMKFLNTNKTCIDLLGGDIYFDKDGNRFAFLTFKNLRKSPIFSLQISFREYSLEGKLIKDGEFFIPYMYARTGEFVNENPIEIDQQTEALEVYIVKAVYDKQKFVNDRLENFKSVDYIEKPSMAPAKKWEYKSNFEFPTDTPSQAPVQEEKVEKVEEVKSAESTPLSNEQPLNEQPAEEKQPEVVSKETINNSPRGTYKKKKLFPYIFPMAAVAVVILVVFLVSMIMIKNGVDALNGF